MFDDPHLTNFKKSYSGKHHIQRSQTELRGLQSLKNAGARIPTLYTSTIGNNATILMARIGVGKHQKKADQWALGEMIAKLHLVTSPSGQFGLSYNNFIGQTPQLNDWRRYWADFFVDMRLGVQLNLMKAHQASPSLFAKLEQALNRIELILKEIDPKPVLLHGDLWSGNVLYNEYGVPYLIDPAIYYGHHEADLAMMTMFGGFDKAFFDAYHAIHPKQSGHDTRLKIYQLYHWLNHAYLFGGHYVQQCGETIESLL